MQKADLEIVDKIVKDVPYDNLDIWIEEVGTIRKKYPRMSSDISVGERQQLEQMQCFKVLQAEGMIGIKKFDDPTRLPPHITPRQHFDGTGGTVFLHYSQRWEYLLEELRKRKNELDLAPEST